MIFINQTANDPVLTFRHNGNPVYHLKLDCANPVGSMPGLPQSESWSINALSQVRLASGGAWEDNIHNVRPGQTVQWRHTLHNNGPDSMSRDVTMRFISGVSMVDGRGVTLELPLLTFSQRTR